MDPASADRTRLEEMFDSFGKAWLKYWESYVILQNQLYETLRAGRELQWLAATDSGKLGEINRLQRELYASMPRRLDYAPLGQISQNLDSTSAKTAELDVALSSEEEACKKLEAGIAILKTQVRAMKEALQASPR